MKIRKVYQKYQIPPNLQTHQIQVARVAKFICEHWKGPNIDQDSILKACLVHDLGNLVKFRLEKYSEFLGEEDLDSWLKIQQKMVQKYGTDDHQATLKMLDELKVSLLVKNIVCSLGFLNTKKMAGSQNWEVKIVIYADMRVSPFGIVSMGKRLREGLKRYSSDEKYKPPKNINTLLKACFEIEKQIQKSTDIDVSAINKQLTKTDDNDLLDLEIG